MLQCCRCCSHDQVNFSKLALLQRALILPQNSTFQRFRQNGRCRLCVWQIQSRADQLTAYRFSGPRICICDLSELSSRADCSFSSWIFCMQRYGIQTQQQQESSSSSSPSKNDSNHHYQFPAAALIARNGMRSTNPLVEVVDARVAAARGGLGLHFLKAVVKL